MKYQNKSFSVPAVGERKECEHGWYTKKGQCVFCGAVPYPGFIALNELPEWIEMKDGQLKAVD